MRILSNEESSKMNIYTITISGADDSVDPQVLEKLSAKYPFVEWGILTSPKRIGQARYPSKKWIEWMLNWSDNLRLSVHLCGDYSRDLLSKGKLTIADDHPELFKAANRMQINFPQMFPEPEFYHSLQLIYDKDIIIQMNSLQANVAFTNAKTEFNIPHVFPFHDSSGGRGYCWQQEAPQYIKGCMNGFAGGLGPDNLREKIQQLDEVLDEHHVIWLDMESNIRTDDKFDLEKVETCLEIAEEFISSETRAATYFETNAGQKRVSQRPPPGQD
jgi:phosphoribosylanthranilate isomerase